jgi:glycosyltransferase involved in cell wall biosynthesis
MDFEPNALGAEWILDELAPRLASRNFKGQIHLVGKNPSSSVLSHAKWFDFVKVHGYLEPHELEKLWLNAKGLLVPHFKASGMRIKLIDGLARGLPVLTHAACLESFKDLDPSEFSLLNLLESSEAWADALLLLEKSAPLTDHSAYLNQHFQTQTYLDPILFHS